MERFRVFSIESILPKKGKVHWFRDLLPEGSMPEIDVRYIHMKPGERIKNHIHELSETLVITIRGRGKIYLDGIEHEVKPGDIAFATKECPHGYETVDEDWEYIIVQCPTIKHKGNITDYISVDESP